MTPCFGAQTARKVHLPFIDMEKMAGREGGVEDIRISV